MATALSETGIFTDVASLSIAPGFIEYDLIVPFWSDGTDKRRWLGVPEDEGIDFDATEPWAFPVGTVLVKHFEIRLDEDDPASLRRLDTRLLIHRAAGWEGFTYRWNEAGTEASLLADRELEALTVETSEGPITFSYTYPSRTDCLRCHLPQAGSVLGLKTRQMNRDFPFPLATDNQLRTYDHIELFATRIGDVAQYETFPRRRREPTARGTCANLSGRQLRPMPSTGRRHHRGAGFALRHASRWDQYGWRRPAGGHARPR